MENTRLKCFDVSGVLGVCFCFVSYRLLPNAMRTITFGTFFSSLSSLSLSSFLFFSHSFFPSLSLSFVLSFLLSLPLIISYR